MASKTAAQQPAKPAKPAKPVKAAKPTKHAKPAARPDKPTNKALRPTTARIAGAVARPAAQAKESSKALTRTVKKPATAKLERRERRERARHEKPGTGRIIRSPSIDRMTPVEANGRTPERRIAPPAALPANGLTCPFSKQELAEWRKLLLQHRQEISQDITHLEQGAMEAEDGHTTPNHIAERGSDAEMQDMSLGLAGEEQVVLWQIDRALRKIDNGSPVPFGLCEHTKQPIPKTRLQLIPWTPVSIEGMNYVEENGLTLEDVLVDG